jgi:hypothetical protein
MQIQLKNETKNLPYVRGQSSTIVADMLITNNNTNSNTNNNVNDEGFVTSTTSSNVTTSNNVMSVTTPSFVSPDISSHYFSPTVTPFGETSDTPPHSPTFDDDEEVAARYHALISSAQTAAKQGDK